METPGSIPSFFFSDRFRQDSLLFSESLLRSMIREKTPLLVFFETHVHLVYTSMVLEADRSRNHLLIDALHPEEGNGHLTPESPLILFGKTSGVETGFRARIRGGEGAGSGRSVQLYFPFETYHCQRRDNLRVPLSPEVAPVRMTTRTGQQELARLVDIGRQGIKVLVLAKNERGEPQSFYREDQILLLSRIDLDGLSLPPLSGKIVHIEPAGREGGEPLLSIGLRFCDLPGDLSEALATFVMRRDHERLRTARGEHLS